MEVSPQYSPNAVESFFTAGRKAGGFFIFIPANIIQ
jgi:hypothetical protein